MSAAEIDVLDREPAEFFAPTSTSLVDSLLAEYRARRQQVDQLHALMGGEFGNVVHYFIEGNAGDERTHRTLYCDKLFGLDGAVHALDAAYWSKALSLTDVYDYMPQARRNAWNEQIRNPAGKRTRWRRNDEAEKWEVEPLPAFTEEAVKPTITGLLAMRSQFFAERVDGVFRGLSRSHVTNIPEGFSKRMIIEYVFSYGSVQHEKAGLINDLRCVIAKFMGRDEPKYAATEPLLRAMARATGEWNWVDGGALRVRVYKKGTAHVEVHPDMAWRLNCVLAQLHPLAIPSEFRARPKAKSKDFKPLARPLPFSVLEVIAAGDFGRYGANSRTLVLNAAVAADAGAEALEEARRVLQSIGGVAQAGDKGRQRFEFDYDAAPVVRELCITGCVPDVVSHQFYPTPRRLAVMAAELAQIGEADSVLEPSAGQGDLAAALPPARTVCVELSSLHCAVLKARGLQTVQADFLEWSEETWARNGRFDRIVMNPPFSEGRAQAHLDAAARLLAPGGRLVAILPATMRNKQALPGLAAQWSPVFEREFVDCSASVVIGVFSNPSK